MGGEPQEGGGVESMPSLIATSNKLFIRKNYTFFSFYVILVNYGKVKFGPLPDFNKRTFVIWKRPVKIY